MVCHVITPVCFSSDEFVLSKLKKEAEDEGTFLARWSVVDYNCIILAVLIKNQVSQHPHSYMEVVAV